MFRSVARSIISIALFAAASPASAETDWRKYDTFVGVKCESPKVQAQIIDASKGLKYDSGEPVYSNAGNIRILDIQTVRASKDNLDCRLTVKAIYKGSSTVVRGMFYIKTLKNKTMWSVRFVPNG